MAKLTLSDVGNLFGSPTSAATTINNNSSLIEAALENTLSRDGSSPNQMLADLDINHNDIINVESLSASKILLNGEEIITGDVYNNDSLKKANNLSDVQSISVTRENLGIGAVATFQSLLASTILTSVTTQFYQNFGANVSRINDRLFIGGATLNNATNVASQPDWLTTYQLAKGRTYGHIQTSQTAVLNTDTSKDSLVASLAAAQTKGRTASGSQVIGFFGLGINNLSGNTGSANNQAWGAYFEGWRDTTSSGNGGAYGFEADAINLTNVIDIDPYQQNGDQTVAAQLASGGEIVGAVDATAAVNVQYNGAAFRKGIVFGANSLSGADGTTGVANAISFAKGHTIQWFGGLGIQTSSILCNGTTASGGLSLLFGENQATFRNASSKTILNVQGVANGVNGVQALGAATGQAVAIQAVGDDINIPLQVSGKGTGQFRSVSIFNPLAGIVGVTDGSNATTGNVGEYVSNSATGISLTSGTTVNVTSISLTAGDWDVSGTVTFVPANTTAPTIMTCGINTTSATFGGLGTQSFLGLSFPTNGQTQGFVAPTQRLNLTTTTTIYLLANSSFTVSTMTANGAIRARRIR